MPSDGESRGTDKAGAESMTHQEIKNAFDFFYASNNIAYDGRKHRYTLDGITCAGVSTVSEFRPAPFLKFWAAKMVVEYLKDKQEIIKNLSPKEYQELLLEAKKMHKTKSDEALEIGTAAHDVCEKIIKSQPYEITPEIKNCVEQFQEFQAKHKARWVCTEKIVVAPSHLVAGRLDSLAFVDGALTLVDLKTSSRVGESYFLQTAGYALCLREMGIPIERRVILRLPKTKDEEFEAVEVDTPLEADTKAFLSQRYAYEWANMVDCKHTETINRGRFKEKKLKLKKI